MKIPRHIAIILDGNGRWAKQRHLPRAMGHRRGCETLEQTIRDAAGLGVEYLTVYAFSTENWKRSADEVSALMMLFRYYTGKLLKVAKEKNVRVCMIGERSRFEPDLQESIERLERETAAHTGMCFVFAVNYGARDEILRAVHRYASDLLAAQADGAVQRSVPKLTEAEFAAYLDTAGMPDPDLVIRTSGEYRLSNYLLWQCAYAEYYFTDVLWPDFNRDELLKAIESYQSRERRFGGRVSEQGTK